MKLSGGHKISFGDKVTHDNYTLFSVCANCKYYKKTSVERKCMLTGKDTEDNCRCTQHRRG